MICEQIVPSNPCRAGRQFKAPSKVEWIYKLAQEAELVRMGSAGQSGKVWRLTKCFLAWGYVKW